MLLVVLLNFFHIRSHSQCLNMKDCGNCFRHNRRIVLTTPTTILLALAFLCGLNYGLVGSITDGVLVDAILIFTPPNSTAHQLKEGKYDFSIGTTFSYVNHLMQNIILHVK